MNNKRVECTYIFYLFQPVLDNPELGDGAATTPRWKGPNVDISNEKMLVSFVVVPWQSTAGMLCCNLSLIMALSCLYWKLYRLLFVIETLCTDSLVCARDPGNSQSIVSSLFSTTATHFDYHLVDRFRRGCLFPYNRNSARTFYGFQSTTEGKT